MAYPTDYGAYSPPYAMPRYGGGGAMPELPSDGTGPYQSLLSAVGTGAGEGPGGSTPYIGGAGDPNFAHLANGGNGLPERPSGGSNYGSYLGWDQGKLNDPTHNTPKYQFLRAMLDAGISSHNRDLSGAVAALKARGYDVDAIPGSSDQIRWGNEGNYDIFNGTNGDFLFGEQTGTRPGGAPNAGAPQPTRGANGLPVPAFPRVPDPNALHTMGSDSTGQTGSSYAAPSPYADGQYGAYRPPYLNGAV